MERGHAIGRFVIVTAILAVASTTLLFGIVAAQPRVPEDGGVIDRDYGRSCLLYTSDAADE